VVAFVLGLLHGFGFSSVPTDTGLAGGTGGAGGSAGGSGGAGPMKVALVDWVTDLAVAYAPDTTPPDTVDDKVDIVIDTSDPAAFAPLLQQQP
jgi:hypothetical protein